MKSKNRGEFSFAALFETGLFIERNAYAEMGKEAMLPGQSLMCSIKATLAFRCFGVLKES